MLQYYDSRKASTALTALMTSIFVFAVQSGACAWETKAMVDNASKLAADVQTYGQDADGTTHCNQFVQAWFALVTGAASQDLDALANTIISNLTSNTAQWTEITNASDWQASYDAATDSAKHGHIVVAAWRNTAASGSDHGHIAIVLPQDQQQGYIGVTPPINGGKGYFVPLIAEASTIDRDCTKTSVDASVRLSCGFSAAKQSEVRFFSYISTQ